MPLGVSSVLRDNDEGVGCHSGSYDVSDSCADGMRRSGDWLAGTFLLQRLVGDGDFGSGIYGQHSLTLPENRSIVQLLKFIRPHKILTTLGKFCNVLHGRLDVGVQPRNLLRRLSYGSQKTSMALSHLPLHSCLKF